MKRLMTALVLGALLVAPQMAAAQNTQTVERELRAFAESLRQAWDSHDAGKYLDFFDPQPTGLFILGGVAYSHAALRTRAQTIMDDRTGESWTNDRVQIIVLSDTSALLQITYSGRYTLKNGQTWEFKSSAFTTSLMQKRAGVWKIVAHQNSASGTLVK